MRRGAYHMRQLRSGRARAKTAGAVGVAKCGAVCSTGHTVVHHRVRVPRRRRMAGPLAPNHGPEARSARLQGGMRKRRERAQTGPCVLCAGPCPGRGTVSSRIPRRIQCVSRNLVVISYRFRGLYFRSPYIPQTESQSQPQLTIPCNFPIGRPPSLRPKLALARPTHLCSPCSPIAAVARAISCPN